MFFIWNLIKIGGLAALKGVLLLQGAFLTFSEIEDFLTKVKIPLRVFNNFKSSFRILEATSIWIPSPESTRVWFLAEFWIFLQFFSLNSVKNRILVFSDGIHWIPDPASKIRKSSVKILKTSTPLTLSPVQVFWAIKVSGRGGGKSPLFLGNNAAVHPEVR